jgi:hypothetical protein
MTELAALISRFFGRGLSSSLLLVIIFFGVESFGSGGVCSAGSPNCQLMEFFKETTSAYGDALGAGICVLLLIGAGYIIGIIHDVLMDDTLRGNFDALLSFRLLRRSTSEDLRGLRDAVTTKLKQDHPKITNSITLNDYNLYEVIGGMIETDTTRYVDEARVYGCLTISLLLSIFVLGIRHSLLHEWSGKVEYVALFLAILIGGREFVKMQYRFRALRMYINYLALDNRYIDSTSTNFHTVSSTPS